MLPLRRVGRDLIAQISELTPANEDEVTNLSRLLNEKMAIYPGATQNLPKLTSSGP